jgi:hypothetical protein
MTTAAEFRKRAQECTQLAKNGRPQDRDILLEIAQAWMKLATQTGGDGTDSFVPTGKQDGKDSASAD